MAMRDLAIDHRNSPQVSGIEFSDLRLAGYRNVNALFPQYDRVYGRETLCGDWNGTTLILSQDFQHTSELKRRLSEDSERNPFFHGQKRATRLLCSLIEPKHEVSIDGTTAKTCGAVIGDAIWLLRDTDVPDYRPTPEAAINVSRPVLLRTIEAMPNLDTILCLGRWAYYAALSACDVEGEWPTDSGRRRWRDAGGIRICSMASLSRRGIRVRTGHFPSAKSTAILAEDFRSALAC